MKLSFKTKLSYGVGGLAENALFTFVGTYLMFFLTTVAGVEPAAAGTITAIGSVWEAFCGPINGYLSDNIKTRYGKRKPFLLAAAFPMAVFSCLLFTTIGAGYTMKLAYYAVMVIMFWWAFATFFVPFMAWGSELTEDYHERTILRTYVYVFTQLGMALGMVAPTVIVDLLMNRGYTASSSWTTVGLTIGVISCVALLICAISIKGKNNKEEKADDANGKIFSLKQIAVMFKEYFWILKLRPIRFLIGASLTFLVANLFFSSDRVYFLTFNAKLDTGMVTLMLLVTPLAGIIFSPLIATISGITDKKAVFLWGIGGTGIVMILLGIIGSRTEWFALVTGIVFAVGNTCYWQLMPSMIYDICAAEELYHGKQHSGTVISLQALAESLATAIGVQLLGIVLQSAKFADNATEQGELALTWIGYSMTLLPGIAMIMVALIIAKYPINKKTFPRILEGIARQRNGEKIDLTKFNDIF